MNALAAVLILSTLLGLRLEQARMLAAEGKTREAIEKYRAVVAERRQPLEGENEIAALTAINELAELLIEENRAAEALTLYRDLPPPADYKAQTSLDYSAAVAAAAANDWSTALAKLTVVIRDDANFASAAELLAKAFANAPPDEAARALENAVWQLVRAGRTEEAREILTTALANSAACGSEERSPLAQALLSFAANANVRSLDAFETTPCQPVRQVALAIDGVLSDNAKRFERGVALLRASSNAPQYSLKQLLKHRTEDAVRNAQQEFALAATLVLMRTGLSETSPVRAAYLLSRQPGRDGAAQTAEEILAASKSLARPDRAAVLLHLGDAAMARQEFRTALTLWLAANEEFRAANEPAPLLKVALARAYRIVGESARVPVYYLAAADDCRTLENQRCTEQVLGEGYAAGAVTQATALTFGVTRETLEKNAPKSGNWPFGLNDGKPRGNLHSPFTPPDSFAMRMERWSPSADFSSMLPLRAGRPAIDAGRVETPVVDRDRYSLSAGGPMIEQRMWGRVTIDQQRTNRAFAAAANDVDLARWRAGITWVPRSDLVLSAEVDQQALDETHARAIPSRSPEATVSRRDRYTIVSAGADLVGRRFVVWLRAEQSRRTSEDEPSPGAGTITLLDGTGFQRNAAMLLRDRVRSEALRVAVKIDPTDNLLLDFGSELRRSDEEAWRRSSRANAQAIDREIAGSRDFDVLRLARSGPVTVSRENGSVWTSLGFSEDAKFAFGKVSGRVGVEFQRSGGESESDGAAANAIAPNLLPAISATRSEHVSCDALLPRVSLTYIPWPLSVTYGRHVSALDSAVISFSDPAMWANIDVGYVDANRNGFPDAEELAVLNPLATYGIGPNVRGHVGPPIYDHLTIGTRRSTHRYGTVEASLTFGRLSYISSTRPLIVDGQGTLRAAMRDDYFADHTIAGKAGPITTYRLRFAPTGSYLLAEDDRRRDIRSANVSWRWQATPQWLVIASGNVTQDEWSYGAAFRERNDPTPLAEGWDRWGFRVGNIENMPAANVYEGADARSLVIPNSRWDVRLDSTSTMPVPFFGPVQVLATFSVRDGYAVSPYVSVFGSDGLQRNVAVTREALRLPSVPSLDLKLSKQLLFSRADVILDLSCVSCLGKETVLRRMNQINNPRAGFVEETVQQRAFIARMRIHVAARS